MERVIEFVAIVPKDRYFSGRARIFENGKLLREIEVLARGSRGPGDTQFLKSGNPPQIKVTVSEN